MVRIRRCGVARAMASLSVAAMALPVVMRAQAARFDSPVVSTQWLADHLNDPNVVVLHLATIRRDYTSGHIPGARFLWFNDVAPSNPEMMGLRASPVNDAVVSRPKPTPRADAGMTLLAAV